MDLSQSRGRGGRLPEICNPRPFLIHTGSAMPPIQTPLWGGRGDLRWLSCQTTSGGPRWNPIPKKFYQTSRASSRPIANVLPLSLTRSKERAPDVPEGTAPSMVFIPVPFLDLVKPSPPGLSSSSDICVNFAKERIPGLPRISCRGSESPSKQSSKSLPA